MARPRSHEARDAALRATLEVLLEQGIEGVTFEEVSAQSGVAKSTLYRHFASKQAMVVEAARSCRADLPTPDTGDLERDLTKLLSHGSGAQEERRVPDVMVNLLAASRRDEELRALLVDVLDEIRTPLRTVLRLAASRGEVRPDVDLEVAVSMLLGPFTHRRLVDQLPIDEEFSRKVLDQVLGGLRAEERKA